MSFLLLFLPLRDKAGLIDWIPVLLNHSGYRTVELRSVASFVKDSTQCNVLSVRHEPTSLLPGLAINHDARSNQLRRFEGMMESL